MLLLATGKTQWMRAYVSKPIKQQALLAVLDKWFPLEYPDVKQEI